MKFRDGMWLVAPDKHVEYAEEVYSLTTDKPNGRLSLLCPTRKIFNRGDTLNRSTIVVDLEAAFDGVISVEVTHFKGAKRRTPEFELYPDGRPSVQHAIAESNEATTLTAGVLSASVLRKEHDFEIAFQSADGKVNVTSLLNRSMGLAYSPPTASPKAVEDMRDRKHYIFTQTELDVGETIHGLGERFGPWNKLGQSIEIWNEDGGTSSDQAYKNVPFWMSSKGYGVFVDHPGKVDLEIGSERCCRLQTSVEGQRLKWFIIYGPTPKEVLTRYSVLTGKPGKVPAWSFGLWLSTSFTTQYDEKTVSSFLEGMKARQTPVEVFHYDCFWLKAFHWCDFVFDDAMFPDPKGMISRFKAEKLINKVDVWINPYLGQASPVFDFAAEKGYLLKRKNGDVWQWDLWQTGMGIVDFTNPEAVEWYVGCLEKLFDVGIDCLKTDFGERIPTTDVAWHDSSVDPERMHNYYAFLFNKIVYQTLQKRYGNDQAVLFARSATAGTQRFPLIWGGDCESTAAALAESVRGGLSIGISGFSFWSCDIGGFEGNPPPWIYKRWVAFGLLCSHSRLHGSNSYRVPWLVDNNATDDQSCTAVLRTFVRLKRQLMPYLFAQAQIASKNGWPMSLRAMALEFPDDPTAWFLDRQFMVGASLLVAPSFREDGETQFYLPSGRWTNMWTGEVVAGPGWRKERYAFDQIAIYVRPRTVLVWGSADVTNDEGFGYDWLSDAHVRLYETQGGEEALVVDSEGNELGQLKVTDHERTLIGLECFKVRPRVHTSPD